MSGEHFWWKLHKSSLKLLSIICHFFTKISCKKIDDWRFSRSRLRFSICAHIYHPRRFQVRKAARFLIYRISGTRLQNFAIEIEPNSSNLLSPMFTYMESRLLELLFLFTKNAERFQIYFDQCESPAPHPFHTIKHFCSTFFFPFITLINRTFDVSYY